MITAAHVLLYSANADADRKFFRDTLGFRSADAGGGWLIFACLLRKLRCIRAMARIRIVTLRKVTSDTGCWAFTRQPA